MSDMEIKENILDAFEFEPSLDAASIGVAVDHGVVTLSGHVPTYGQKLKAEELAMAIRGVKAIAQELEVRPIGTHLTADDEIASRVLHVLRWGTTLPADAVKVKVQAGWLTLSGSVEWNYQREAAARAVRDMAGVKGVTNAIVIEAKASPADIRDRIEKALKRQAELDMKDIRVEVTDGSVTLEGKVHSLAERRAVEQAVWAAPGIREVRDRLSVV
ncbi:MAG: ornithine aminotransferase [Rhodobacter sp.]|nr:ornithine aminotransferase [Rhodobacter sp.]